MPGTVDSHPNWIQKTPMTLDEIIRDERFKDLAETLNRYFVIVQTSSP
jgi:4-alpha-glucanotransferase